MYYFFFNLHIVVKRLQNSAMKCIIWPVDKSQKRENLTNDRNGMLKESSLVHRRKEVKTKRSFHPSMRHIAWGLEEHTAGWWMSVCIPSRQENQTRAQRGVNVSLEYGRMDMLVRLCIFVMPFHAENIIICSLIFFSYSSGGMWSLVWELKKTTHSLLHELNGFDFSWKEVS